MRPDSACRFPHSQTLLKSGVELIFQFLFDHLLAGMPNPLSNQVTYLSRKTDLDGKLTFINQAECGARQIAGGKILWNFKPVPEEFNLPDPVNQK